MQRGISWQFNIPVAYGTWPILVRWFTYESQEWCFSSQTVSHCLRVDWESGVLPIHLQSRVNYSHIHTFDHICIHKINFPIQKVIQSQPSHAYMRTKPQIAFLQNETWNRIPEFGSPCQINRAYGLDPAPSLSLSETSVSFKSSWDLCYHKVWVN